MTDIEQLPFVERYYARAFPTHAPSRPVDYYLATWGASSGLPLDFVLAHAGDHLYEVNAGLDTNSDGQITVSDLASALAVTMQRAGGTRLDASPKASAPAPGSAPAEPSSRQPLASLPVLRLGDVGSAVDLARVMLARYGYWRASTLPGALWLADEIAATTEFQRDTGLVADGILGPKTWEKLRQTLVIPQ